MRTTLTIDDDNAVRLERLRKERGVSIKDAVNDVIRSGLDQLEAPPKKREPFRTNVYDPGEFLMPGKSFKEILHQMDEEHFQKKLFPK